MLEGVRQCWKRAAGWCHPGQWQVRNVRERAQSDLHWMVRIGLDEKNTKIARVYDVSGQYAPEADRR